MKTPRTAGEASAKLAACLHRGNWYNDQLRYDLARIVFILFKRLVCQAREYRNSLARLPAPAV